MDREEEKWKNEIACVHGMVHISCWIGHEILHRSVTDVPVEIVAYNHFMNSMHCVDEKQAQADAIIHEYPRFCSRYGSLERNGQKWIAT